MLRALILMTTTIFFLVLFFGAIAEPLQILFDTIEPLLGTGSDGTAGGIDGVGVLNQIRAYLFVLVPLIVGAGSIVLAFIFAVRLRGTSGPGVNR
jgi:hypothetical protein